MFNCAQPNASNVSRVTHRRGIEQPVFLDPVDYPTLHDKNVVDGQLEALMEYKEDSTPRSGVFQLQPLIFEEQVPLVGSPGNQDQMDVLSGVKQTNA